MLNNLKPAACSLPLKNANNETAMICTKSKHLASAEYYLPFIGISK